MGYAISVQTKYAYLTFGGWLSFLANKNTNPSVAQAKGTSPLHILDESAMEIKMCTVYDCFGYELSVAGRVYVLSSGVWYGLVPDFVAGINETIKQIPHVAPALPAWNQGVVLGHS